jgi:hypothetical protein
MIGRFWLDGARDIPKSSVPLGSDARLLATAFNRGTWFTSAPVFAELIAAPRSSDIRRTPFLRRQESL